MLFGPSRLGCRTRLNTMLAIAGVCTFSFIGVSASGAGKIENPARAIGGSAGAVELAGGRTLVPKRVRLIIDFKQTVTV